MPSNLEKLRTAILRHEWLMEMLSVVRDVNADCWIGAGAIRDAVWDSLSQRRGRPPVNDIDVVYFDPDDVSEGRDQEIEERLKYLVPAEDWEVTNQAGVHLWFHKKFGYEVEPFSSLEDAVASWPEFASCVAARITDRGNLEIIAPHGVDDLMDMVVRRNPARVTVKEFNRRTESKQYEKRWPDVEIIDP